MLASRGPGDQTRGCHLAAYLRGELSADKGSGWQRSQHNYDAIQHLAFLDAGEHGPANEQLRRWQAGRLSRCTGAWGRCETAVKLCQSMVQW